MIFFTNTKFGLLIFNLLLFFKPKIFIFLCFVFNFFTLLKAQEVVTLHLTDKEGLPDYEIYDILEDSKGYIWLAANRGLFRYDGKEYTFFSHPQKRGLSVFGLLQDDKGNVWVNNISGQFFYVDEEKMHLFADLKDQINGKLSEFKILNNELIALTENGIYKQSLAAKKGAFYKDLNVASVYYHSPFIMDKQFYFLHANKVRKFTNNQFSLGLNLNITKKSITRFIYLKQKDKHFFSFNDNKSNLLEYHNNQFISHKLDSLNQKIIHKILSIDDDIWFCTSAGVYVYQQINNKLVFKKNILNQEVVTNALKDKNQNYWISTLQNGIFVIPNIHVLKLNKLDKLKITDLEKINNQFTLFGTFDGKLGWIDTQNLTHNVFNLPSASRVTKILFDQLRQVVYISQDNSGLLWDIKQKKLFKFNQIVGAKTLSVHHNRLLYGTYNCAKMINLPNQKDTLSKSIKLRGNPQLSPKNIKYNFKELRSKRSYASGFIDSLFYIGYVDGFFWHQDQNISEIKFQNRSVFSVDLAIDRQKNVWVSTLEDGLIKINNHQLVKHFSVKNGLLSNNLGKLKLDNNLLWIAHDRGLQLLNTKTLGFQNLLKSDGLETYDYIDLEITKNHLILATKKGLYLWNKKHCFKPYHTPNIFITSVEINNTKTQNINKLILDYNSNSIKIAFNVTGFQKEEFISYQYRLKENDNWQYLDKGINFVKYNSLPSGTYVFEVKAINQNGIASHIEKVIFEVKSPYWQKWWFYLVITMATILLTWYLFQVTSQKKQQKQEQLLLQAKTERELIFFQLENLRSQMNPHFIFNALNSIQEYIVCNEKDLASTFLVKFSRLMRLYLNQSKNQEILLEEEVEALQLYLELEKDRFEDTLNYTIRVDPDLLQKTIFIPSLFVQPYVENAIKHGLLHKLNNRNLSIEFNLKNNQLICIIDDNGVGRKEANRFKKEQETSYKSFATSANQKRVDLLNRTRKHKISVKTIDKVDSQNIAQGTQVIIKIPI